MSIGIRLFPVRSDTMRTSVFCWFVAVTRSRKIFDTCCPVVPDEVIVLNTSSSATLCSSISLKRRTGRNGTSSTERTLAAEKPTVSIIRA